MSTVTTHRIPELDGLRGCAIAMVLLFHFAPDLPQNRVLHHVVSWGWAGVDLFFVLSGFLITRILLRTRGRPDYFRSFYLRRSLRIFPVYYWTLIAVAVLFITAPVLRPILPSAHDRFLYWFYLSNWTPLLDQLNQHALGHFWSLAVEEQFYWFWPLAVFVVRPKWLMPLACGLFAMAVALRIGLANFHFFIRWNTFCHTDSLMTGALSALAWQTPNVKAWIVARAKYLIVAVLLICGGLVVGDRRLGERFTDTAGLAGLALAFGALLWYALFGPGPVRAFFRSPVLGWLGIYSYGIYVYHQPLYFALIQLHAVPRGWPMLVTSVGTTLGLAFLSYRFVESRLLQINPWHSPSDPPAQPAEAVALPQAR